ncbi:hypothetical protein HHI36_016103 [Cryptolaemus montrouzieri]|uniref:Uncharacterized protein n=1 Tax=Cryptolaemus montrouzieri TaxID=559131 RepID=A0ABD2NIM7_9CUCU
MRKSDEHQVPEPDDVSPPSTSLASTSSSSSVARAHFTVEAQLSPVDRENYETPQKKKKISDYFPSDSYVRCYPMVAKDGLLSSEDMKNLFASNVTITNCLPRQIQ